MNDEAPRPARHAAFGVLAAAARAAVAEHDGDPYRALYATAWHTAAIANDDQIIVAVMIALEQGSHPSDFGGASPLFAIRRAKAASAAGDDGELWSFGAEGRGEGSAL